MKVLILAYHFAPAVGGIQTYSHELARALYALKCDVMVICRHEPGCASFDADEPYPIRRLRLTRIPWLKAVHLYLYYHFISRQIRFDVVHCINWVPCGPAAVLATPAGIPIIFTCYGSEITQWQDNPLRRVIRNWVFSRADQIIVSTKFLQDMLKSYGILTPSHVVAFGLPAKAAAPDTSLRDMGKPILLTVGDLKPRKGVRRMIDALPLVVRKIPDLEYVVIGRGREKQNILDAVRRQDMGKHFCLIEDADYETVLQWMERCTLFIMLNQETADKDIEGFGLVFLEAARAGKPVIAAAEGSIPEVVVNGVTGILLDPGCSCEQIAVQAARLIQDNTLRQHMGKAGKRRFEEIFTSEIMAQKTMKIYCYPPRKKSAFVNPKLFSFL